MSQQPCRRRRHYRAHARQEEILPVETTGAAADPVAQLSYIRATLESAGSFTAVSGKGTMAIGLTACIAAYIASQLEASGHLNGHWFKTWIAEAGLALLISLWSMNIKAKRAGEPLSSRPARKFALSFSPPLLVGALLTVILLQMGAVAAVPPMWLMLYGTAVITGGAFSVGIVPVMGLCFLALGVLATFLPIAWADWYMLLGFGGLHLIFGALIAQKHGG